MGVKVKADVAEDTNLQKVTFRVNMRANVLYAPSKGHFQPKNQCKCPLYRVKRTAPA